MTTFDTSNAAPFTEHDSACIKTVLQGTDEEGSIAGLQDDRDEACAEAENLSQRLMFDAATSDSISDIGRQFCLEALECAKFETENILTNLGEDLPEDPSIDELYASNSAFAYNNCYAESDESLEGFRNDTCGTSDTSRDRNSLTQGFGGCQSLVRAKNSASNSVSQKLTISRSNIYPAPLSF